MKSIIEMLKDLLKSLKVSFTIPLGTFSKKNTSVSASGKVNILNMQNKHNDLSINLDIKPQTPDTTPTQSDIQPISNLNITPRHQFIIKIRQGAYEIYQQYKIDVLLAITQAAHESNWGLSELTVRANNLFGKTAGSWYAQRRPVIWMLTREESPLPPDKIKYWEYADDIVDKQPDGKGGSILKVNRPFRKYASWDHSLQDWAMGLSSRTIYKDAYTHACNANVVGFFQALQVAGYATDSNYAKKLLGVYDVVSKISQEITNV